MGAVREVRRLGIAEKGSEVRSSRTTDPLSPATTDTSSPSGTRHLAVVHAESEDGEDATEDGVDPRVRLEPPDAQERVKCRRAGRPSDRWKVVLVDDMAASPTTDSSLSRR